MRNSKAALTMTIASLLLLTFTACDQASHDDTLHEPESTVNQYRTWDEYLASLETDDLGKYKVVSANGIEGEGGFVLNVEQRYYVELEKARFVVEQKNLGLQTQATEIQSMNFSVTDGQDPLVAQALAPSTLSSQGLSDVLLSTDLYPVEESKRELPESMCAALDISFADKALYPINLNTCQQRG